MAVEITRSPRSSTPSRTSEGRHGHVCDQPQTQRRVPPSPLVTCPRACVSLTHEGDRLAWTIEAGDEPGAYSVRVDASCSDESTPSPCEPIGGTCLSAEVGVSPGHDGALEAARMTPRFRHAQVVEINDLDSAFLASFTSAVTAPSYLMRDVDVTWTRARVPRLEGMEAVV